LALAADTPPGVYGFQVQGVSGSLTRSVEMTLLVADFSMSCSHANLSIPAGSSGNSQCTVSMQRNTGYDSASFSCANLPVGVLCTHDPDSVVPPEDGSATSALTVAVSPSTPPGTYSFQVQAWRPGTVGHIRTFDMTLEVTPPPDFTLSCSASTLTILRGSSGNSACTVGSQHGFASAVDLSCSDLPAGVSCSYNPDPLTPPANGSATSTLTLAVPAGISRGTYSFGVQGVSGSLTRRFNMTLQVVSH
jgi:hypothetical protein